MAIRQITMTEQTSIRSVLHSKAFMMGYSDIKEGRPFRYDHFDNINDQWNYERGRIYGAVSEVPVKIGKRVNYSACYAAGKMLDDGILL